MLHREHRWAGSTKDAPLSRGRYTVGHRSLLPRSISSVLRLITLTFCRYTGRISSNPLGGRPLTAVSWSQPFLSPIMPIVEALQIAKCVLISVDFSGLVEKRMIGMRTCLALARRCLMVPALLVGCQDQPVSPTKKITWLKDGSEMVLIPADVCQD